MPGILVKGDDGLLYRNPQLSGPYWLLVFDEETPPHLCIQCKVNEKPKDADARALAIMNEVFGAGNFEIEQQLGKLPLRIILLVRSVMQPVIGEKVVGFVVSISCRLPVHHLPKRYRDKGLDSHPGGDVKVY